MPLKRPLLIRADLFDLFVVGAARGVLCTQYEPIKYLNVQGQQQGILLSRCGLSFLRNLILLAYFVVTCTSSTLVVTFNIGSSIHSCVFISLSRYLQRRDLTCLLFTQSLCISLGWNSACCVESQHIVYLGNGRLYLCQLVKESHQYYQLVTLQRISTWWCSRQADLLSGLPSPPSLPFAQLALLQFNWFVHLSSTTKTLYDLEFSYIGEATK